jgi:hypothetical protein
MMCCRGLRAERSALFPRHASRGLPCSFAEKVTWDIEDRKPPSLFRMGLKIRLNENLHCFLAGVHFDTNRSTAEINLVTTAVLPSDNRMCHVLITLRGKPIL